MPTPTTCTVCDIGVLLLNSGGFLRRRADRHLPSRIGGVRQPRRAEAKTAGSFDQRGRAANNVSSRAVVAAVRLSVNHGGFGDSENSPCSRERGAGRNGPRTTVFSVWSSS